MRGKTNDRVIKTIGGKVTVEETEGKLLQV